jgi:hypothetical protein
MTKQKTDQELDAIAMKTAIDRFKKSKENNGDSESNNVDTTKTTQMPSMSSNIENYEAMGVQQTDPDLIVGHEIVKLPSKGLFYANGLSELKIEYLTAKDEDILTTPSLIQSGEALDLVMKKKIKTPNVVIDNLLIGDQNAIALFLRASSYGHEYQVQVTDPRNGKEFPYTVDLRKIGYKEIIEKPDKDGLFQFYLPMRKKDVKFRLLNAKDSKKIISDVEHMQEAGYSQIAEFTSMKIKAHIVEINGNRDRGYINNFVNAMPAGDALKLRRKILDVTPDLDLLYEFSTSDGYKFKTPLIMGIDFFFPSL